MSVDRRPIELDPTAASRLLVVLAGSLGSDAANSDRYPVVPGYTVDHPLGQGGAGAVYKAFRSGSDRPVALKILRAGAGSPGAERSWRELQMLDHLHLPSIPRLIDYGFCEGHLYIATELVDGLPLDRHCRERNLDRRSRVELMVRTAAAVQSLHEHGVIHRDIKPSNVLVTNTGIPVVVDLGLAIFDSLAVCTATMTTDGQPIGTPAFMAPEQARGERSAVSTRTDVYALGATAYVILAGATPHEMPSSIHDAVRRVAQDPAREPRLLDPTLPRALAAVLRKACEHDPQRRYASAAEFEQDLRRWLKGDPVTAGEISVWARVARWAGKHPVVATAAVCALVFAVGAGGYRAASRRLWGAVPDYATVTPDRKVARVFSRDGYELAEWRMTGDSGITAIDVFPRPARFGGGRVVLGVLQTGEQVEWSHRLALWESPDLTKPRWIAPCTAPGIVAPRRDSSSERKSFFSGRFLVADVFDGPDYEGNEIIILHNEETNCDTSIRVYDFGGTCLYEAWHYGGVQNITWLPATRQIVCAGVNQEADWSAILGRDELDTLPPSVPAVPTPRPNSAVNAWPVVAFALRPEPGRHVGWVHAPRPAHLAARRRRFPNESLSEPADPAAQMSYYKWLVPGTPIDYFSSINVRQEMGTLAPGDTADFVVTCPQDYSVGWHVRSDGSVLPGEVADVETAQGFNPYAVFRLLDDLPDPAQ